MSLDLITAVTGGAQTGFTTPSFNLTVDTPPDNRSRQSVVASLAGTQGTAVAHSISAPFTVLVRRPSIWKTIMQAMVNGVTGRYSKIPFNETVILIRKAAQVATGQWVVNEHRMVNKIYAGTETFDPNNVRAGVSCAVGFINRSSAGLGDTVTSGVL